MFSCFPFTSSIIFDMDHFLDQRLIEEENMLAPSLKQFSLRVEILPSYIPVRVAEKILFVGESVQMFENQNVNLTRKGRNLFAQWIPPSKALLTWHCVTTEYAWSHRVASNVHVRRCQHNHDVLAEKQVKELHPQDRGTLAYPGRSVFLWQCLPILQDPFWKTKRTLLLQSCIVSSSSHSSAWWILSKWWIVFVARWLRFVFQSLFS